MHLCLISGSVMVSVSRVYLGVHSIADILAGVIPGFILLLIYLGIDDYIDHLLTNSDYGKTPHPHLIIDDLCPPSISHLVTNSDYGRPLPLPPTSHYTRSTLSTSHIKKFFMYHEAEICYFTTLNLSKFSHVNCNSVNALLYSQNQDTCMMVLYCPHGAKVKTIFFFVFFNNWQ